MKVLVGVIGRLIAFSPCRHGAADSVASIFVARGPVSAAGSPFRVDAAEDRRVATVGAARPTDRRLPSSRVFLGRRGKRRPERCRRLFFECIFRSFYYAPAACNERCLPSSPTADHRDVDGARSTIEHVDIEQWRV